MDIYQEKILEHYNNPKNFGLKKKDGYVTEPLENLSCGDQITMQVLLDKSKIIDVRFEGEGCAISIASASILTELAKGKDIKFFESFDIEDLQKELGITLTLSRIKCANLSLEAIKKALKIQIID